MGNKAIQLEKPETKPKGVLLYLSNKGDVRKITDRIRKAVIDEDKIALYRALQRSDRNPSINKDVMNDYSNAYHGKLIEDIKKFLKDTELEYALQLLNLGHPNSKQHIVDGPMNDDEITIAAKRLKEAMDPLWSTDEEAVYAALFPFKKKTVLLQQKFYDLYNQDLRDEIVGEMSGSELGYGLELLETRYQYFIFEANNNLMSIAFSSKPFGLDWFYYCQPRIKDTSEGPKLEKAGFDTRYWEGDRIIEVMQNSDKMESCMVRSKGADPAFAFDQLVANIGKWEVACHEYTQLIHLYALRHVFSADWFNSRVGPALEIKRTKSTGVRTDYEFTRESPHEKMRDSRTGSPDPRNVDSILTEAPIGSRIRWTNVKAKITRIENGQKREVVVNPWGNENTIKLGPNKFAAHGTKAEVFGISVPFTDNILTQEKIIEEIADNTEKNRDKYAGYKDPEYAASRENYIKNNIYISEIEIFNDPSAGAKPL